MTKNELIVIVADQCDLPRATVSKVVNTLFALMRESLIMGAKVRLTGIGSLEPRFRSYTFGGDKLGETVGVSIILAEAFRRRLRKELLPKAKQ